MNELQRIDPDTRQVFNGIEVSFGIAPILSTLSDLSRRPNRPAWTLYLINVETIIRDRKEKDVTPEAMAKGVITDCTVLAQYIAAYCRYTLPAKLNLRPLICFYLPHYEQIPALYLRKKLPKGTEERWHIRGLVENILNKEGFPARFEETDVICSVPEHCLGQQWPHKELLKDLVTTQDGIRYRKVLMVSHVPLDFHLYRTFADFSLLESFTGAIKQPKQFGKKVFGDDAIPFNKYTHLLLGDKWYLEPQIKGAAKKTLKEMALRQRWSLLPDKAIAEALVGARVAIPELFLKPTI